MRKSLKSAVPPKGNSNKYESYKEAWTRINQAYNSGFYLECLALQESIISDRVSSYLRFHGVYPSNGYASLFNLLRAWERYGHNNDNDEVVELRTMLQNDWRKARNAAIHGLVGSESGQPTMAVELFLDNARNAAKIGTELTKRIQSWHKSEIGKRYAEK